MKPKHDYTASQADRDKTAAAAVRALRGDDGDDDDLPDGDSVPDGPDGHLVTALKAPRKRV